MRWLVMALVLVFAVPAAHADTVKLRDRTTKPVAKKPAVKKPVRAAKRKPVVRKPVAKAKPKKSTKQDEPEVRLRPMP